MPYTAGDVSPFYIPHPTFLKKDYDVLDVINLFASDVTFPGVTGKMYLWDNSEKFVDWQLANSVSNDAERLMDTLAISTDGYAIHVEINVDKSKTPATNDGFGFCIQASTDSANCFYMLKVSGAWTMSSTE